MLMRVLKISLTRAKRKRDIMLRMIRLAQIQKMTMDKTVNTTYHQMNTAATKEEKEEI
jgi:hypothetical protein